MKKLLILGADGFLGRHIIDYVQTTCKCEIIKADIHKDRPLRTDHLDITSYKDVFYFLNKTRPEIIVNSSGIFNPADYELMYKVNCLGSINIFESVLKIKKWSPKVFIIGSAAEYGQVKKNALPVKESFPLSPLSHYGISKAAQTHNAIHYFGKGLRIYVGRVFNMIGDGLSDTFAPSSFARQIAEIELGLRGDVIKVGNIESKRDFVDVSDVVKAVFAILKKGREGEIYNICSGRSYSLKDIINNLREISKAEFRVQTESTRVKPFDVPDIYGAYAKLKKDTGWCPAVPIESSLSNMLNGWREKLR